MEEFVLGFRWLSWDFEHQAPLPCDCHTDTHTHHPLRPTLPTVACLQVEPPRADLQTPSVSSVQSLSCVRLLATTWGGISEGLRVLPFFPLPEKLEAPPFPVPFEILPDTVPPTPERGDHLQKKSRESGFLIASNNPDFLFLFVSLPQIFSQEYINLLLSMYFFVLGILALSHTIRSEGLSATFEAAFSRASTGSRMRT